jgi:hypothetical protein
MIGKPKKSTARRDARRRNSAYVLIARGPNGRVRAERFTDVASYRVRLARIDQSDDSADRGLSIEEIAGLLDS